MLKIVPPYYPCRRTGKYIYVEDLRRITKDKVVVFCKYYDSGSSGINEFPCTKNSPIRSSCLVEMLVKQ